MKTKDITNEFLKSIVDSVREHNYNNGIRKYIKPSIHAEIRITDILKSKNRIIIHYEGYRKIQ